MSENPYSNQDPANPYGVPPQEQPAEPQQPSSQPYGEAPYGQAYGQQVPPAGQPYGQPIPPLGQPYGAAGQQFAWSDKSKLAAGLLGILLGAFGVHNFYLGNTGKAVAQLLITVVSLGTLSFVSAIWGIVEGVLILAAAPGTQWSLDREGKVLRPSNV